jgi:hypothetical protein
MSTSGTTRKRRWPLGSRSRLTRGSAFGEESACLFGGVGFATFGLGEADVQALVDAVAIAEQPIFCGGFGFQEIKGVGEEFGGFAEAAAVEFTLDAGFGGGVEGQAHGESIALAVLVKCWFRRRQVGRCACGFTPAFGSVVVAWVGIAIDGQAYPGG